MNNKTISVRLDISIERSHLEDFAVQSKQKTDLFSLSRILPAGNPFVKTLFGLYSLSVRDTCHTLELLCRLKISGSRKDEGYKVITAKRNIFLYMPGLWSFSRKYAGKSNVKLGEILPSGNPLAEFIADFRGLSSKGVRILLRRAGYMNYSCSEQHKKLIQELEQREQERLAAERQRIQEAREQERLAAERQRIQEAREQERAAAEALEKAREQERAAAEALEKAKEQERAAAERQRIQEAKEKEKLKKERIRKRKLSKVIKEIKAQRTERKKRRKLEGKGREGYEYFFGKLYEIENKWLKDLAGFLLNDKLDIKEVEGHINTITYEMKVVYNIIAFQEKCLGSNETDTKLDCLELLLEMYPKVPTSSPEMMVLYRTSLTRLVRDISINCKAPKDVQRIKSITEYYLDLYCNEPYFEAELQEVDSQIFFIILVFLWPAIKESTRKRYLDFLICTYNIYFYDEYRIQEQFLELALKYPSIYERFCMSKEIKFEEKLYLQLKYACQPKLTSEAKHIYKKMKRLFFSDQIDMPQENNRTNISGRLPKSLELIEKIHDIEEKARYLMILIKYAEIGMLEMLSIHYNLAKFILLFKQSLYDDNYNFNELEGSLERIMESEQRDEIKPLIEHIIIMNIIHHLDPDNLEQDGKINEDLIDNLLTFRGIAIRRGFSGVEKIIDGIMFIENFDDNVPRSSDALIYLYNKIIKWLKEFTSSGNEITSLFGYEEYLHKLIKVLIRRLFYKIANTIIDKVKSETGIIDDLSIDIKDEERFNATIKHTFFRKDPVASDKKDLVLGLTMKSPPVNIMTLYLTGDIKHSLYQILTLNYVVYHELAHIFYNCFHGYYIYVIQGNVCGREDIESQKNEIFKDFKHFVGEVVVDKVAFELAKICGLFSSGNNIPARIREFANSVYHTTKLVYESYEKYDSLCFLLKNAAICYCLAQEKEINIRLRNKMISISGKILEYFKKEKMDAELAEKIYSYYKAVFKATSIERISNRITYPAILYQMGQAYEIPFSDGRKTLAILPTYENLRNLGIDLSNIFEGGTHEITVSNRGALISYSLYEQRALLRALIEVCPGLRNVLGFYNVGGSVPVYKYLWNLNVRWNFIDSFWVYEKLAKEDFLPEEGIVTLDESVLRLSAIRCILDRNYWKFENGNFPRGNTTIVFGAHIEQDRDNN